MLNLNRKILSFIILTAYVISTAHAGVPHHHEDSHNHHDHTHHNSEDQHVEGQHIFEITKGVLHSVVHFIENLSHNHTCSEQLAVYESSNLSQHLADTTLESLSLVSVTPNTNTDSFSETTRLNKRIYLLNNSLRGPPALV